MISNTAGQPGPIGQNARAQSLAHERWAKVVHPKLRFLVRAQPVLSPTLCVALCAVTASLIERGHVSSWALALLLILPAALAASDSASPQHDDDLLLERSLRMTLLLGSLVGPAAILSLAGAWR